MLSGEGNAGERSKTTLHVQHPFLYISLPLFCTTTTRSFQRRFFMEEMSYASRSQIFHCGSFSPCINTLDNTDKETISAFHFRLY